ncbi:manganese efflux pump MntP family protein [Marininema halotolerans]|uniref:Putative manganese efflux pump MntP n=1 Tax=Marininema halotolerans TaxID=1155944 RepID=A0A1I6P3C8_9BACL|nr:manganese efflux pump MntP family protein [Marininema halotolerans]SFS34703.1 Putative Mn2+ efflux pump MntP [Marininema halotolerans]
MELSTPQWGQLVTLLMVAVALGMDAFSLGIGIGMRGILQRQIVVISGTIGLFHILMPLMGFAIGRYLGKVVENIAVMTGGGVLCFLGINMIWNAFRSEEEARVINTRSMMGVCLFSISVSLDSLSAGLSLGLFSADIWLTVILFGMMGAIMAGAGLFLGRHVGTWIGDYGEAVGGVILFFLGLRFLW